MYCMYNVMICVCISLLSCSEYFGSESVAVQEEKREEAESRRASLSRVRRSESQKSPTSAQSPT